VSATARGRYFVEDGDGFRVGEPLRARVRVARRDMLTDGVPGRFDLVLLRNVIIYFDAEAKERLFRLVHESLADRGLLVLGQSETMVGGAGSLFRPLSLRNRVYAKVAA
jgi:chemotaxis protein methyltransferase CheR